MRLTRFAFAKAILVASLALGFLIIFGFPNIAQVLKRPIAALPRRLFHLIHH